MNRPPNPCIFCGRLGNMSDQHVFPDRLKRVLPRHHGTRQYGAYDTVRRGGKTVREGEKVKQNQGSVGTSRVRKVCKPCNEGWLNTMEQDSFPVVEQLIRGEKASLRKDDQAKLSRIATSIAMVGEWLSMPHVTTTQEEREFFRDTLEPPMGWHVFLGRNDSDYVTPFRFGDGVRSVEKGVDGPKHFAVYTMAMGPVLLHILAADPDNIIHVDMYARNLGLAAICPPTDWIVFPFMPALGSAEIARIRTYALQSFRRHTEGK